MCPSVCSSGRQSGGRECFQSGEVLQVVNINSLVVEANPACHRQLLCGNGLPGLSPHRSRLLAAQPSASSWSSCPVCAAEASSLHCSSWMELECCGSLERGGSRRGQRLPARVPLSPPSPRLQLLLSSTEAALVRQEILLEQHLLPG